MRGVPNRVFLTGGYMGVFFTFLWVWWCSFLRAYCRLPQFWPMPSMSRGMINCGKLFLSHPFSRIKSFDQWAVDQDP